MTASEPLGGWTGRLLFVDLQRGRCETRRLDTELLRARLGGRGLGSHFLRPACTLAWDDPDMPVSICAGPLVGTISPTSGRVHLTSRSPLTGAVGDSSVGGRLGTQLKRAGWDAVLITGKSNVPCGLEINNSEARLVPAPELSGLRTSEVFAALPHFKSVACIGPAAEHGSPLACIAVDRHHAAGRTGLGLSLAAKNLKYLAINGSGKISLADKQALIKARESIVRLTMASPALMGQQGIGCFGTASLYDLMDARRMMPTDNFQRTHFDRAPELNAFAYRQRYQPENHGCTGCHVLCKKVSNGTALPEFEVMSHFTALIGSADLDLVVRANTLCNDLGLDAISAGSTLACLREIRGRNFETDEVEQLLQRMGQAPDLASSNVEDILPMGAAAVAAAAGRPELAMTAKSLELAAYDPRGAYGMALAFAVSTRGGCHLRAYPVSHEILRKPVATDRFSFSGKARMIKIAEDQNAVVDSLTACKFLFFAASLEEYARAYAAATGVTGPEATAQSLMHVGERIVYEERIMNALNGFSAADDDLPERFFSEPGTSGDGIDVPPLDRTTFLEARARYYRIRGLDENGLPTQEKAEALGLSCSNS